MAAAMTGAGIGVGVARKFNADQLVVVSAATAGMVGAFAGKLLAGQVLTEGNMLLIDVYKRQRYHMIIVTKMITISYGYTFLKNPPSTGTLESPCTVIFWDTPITN